MDVGTAIAMQAQQLQILREEISQKLADLKEGGGADDGEQGKRNLKSTRSKQLPHVCVVHEKSVEPLSPKMSNMVRRLEELEAEEEVIRQRWNAIVYEDPLTTRPPVAFQKNATLTDSQITPLCIAEERKVTTLPIMSSKSLSHIEEYKEQYSRYLSSTGLSTQGGFDPWKMAER